MTDIIEKLKVFSHYHHYDIGNWLSDDFDVSSVINVINVTKTSTITIADNIINNNIFIRILWDLYPKKVI